MPRPASAAADRTSRAKLAQTVVQNGAKDFFEGLTKKYDVQYWGFDRGMAQIGVDPAHLALPEPAVPGGGATQIGDAIGKILDEAAGRQIAGIVLFSDGQNNGGRSPGEAASAAGAAKSPVFAVPVGSAKRLQDVAIVDVFATTPVTVEDTVRVSVAIESSGFDKRPVKVELRDGDLVIDSKDLILRDTEQQQIELTFKATKPGTRYLTVNVPIQPEEPVHLHFRTTARASSSASATRSSRSCISRVGRPGTSASSRTPCAGTTASAAGPARISTSSSSRNGGSSRRPCASRRCRTRWSC